MAGSEVRNRLVEDGPAGCDDGKVVHSVGRQVLDCRGEHVGLAHAGRQVHHRLEGRGLPVDFVMPRDLEDDALQCFAVGLPQVKPRSDAIDAVEVERVGYQLRRAHAGAASPSGMRARLIGKSANRFGCAHPGVCRYS